MKNAILGIFLLSLNFSFAQGESEEEQLPPHRITIMMANSHIPRADEVNGEKRIFITPTWAINYDYWISDHWAIGLHNDIIIQQFNVETVEQGILSRSFPLSVSAVGLYKPFDNWIFMAGLGREFEKTENIDLFTLGVEYGVELGNNWELNFNVIFENKIEVYDSWLFGIGFSKYLGKTE